MYNTLELSGIPVCLGGLIKFFSAWGTEEIAGFWFARTGGGEGGGLISRLTLDMSVNFFNSACVLEPVCIWQLVGIIGGHCLVMY